MAFLITLNEVYSAILHSWALFRGDRGALAAFDSSYDGFWRSFMVILVLAPFYVIVFMAEQRMILTDPAGAPAAFSTGAFLFWKSVSALVDWIAFPILMAALARPLNFSNRYALLIVGRNWTSILAILPFAVVSLLFGIGLLPPGGLLVMSLLLMIVMLRFRYQVFSAALGGPTSLVIGFVALDFLFSFLIGVVINRLTGIVG